MPVQPTYPGVYIEEVPSGVRTITGVSTSITAFVGYTKKGPLNEPTTILSFSDFEREFGGLSKTSILSYAVHQFFLNGGQQAIIVRIAKDGTAVNAAIALDRIDSVSGSLPSISLTAKQPGTWANGITISVDYDTAHPESTFNLRLEDPTSEGVEEFLGVSMNSGSKRYVKSVVNGSSQLVEVEIAGSTLDAIKNDPGISVSGSGISASSVDEDHFKFMITLVEEDGAQEVKIFSGSGPGPASLDDLGLKIKNAVTELGTSEAYTKFSYEKDDASGILTLKSGLTGDKAFIRISSATSKDAAAVLKLGVANGGRVIDGAAEIRPAPVGTTTGELDSVPTLAATDQISVTIDGDGPHDISVFAATDTQPTTLSGLATLLESKLKAVKPNQTGSMDFMGISASVVGRTIQFLSGADDNDSVLEIESVPSRVTLNGAFFLSADEGWAVGDSGTVLRWAKHDGVTASWKATTEGSSTLHAVFFLDSSNGWAVGDGGTILTYDGAGGWTASTVGSETLRGIHFSSMNWGWAVGDNGTLLQWNAGGSTWDTKTAPATKALHAVHVTEDGADRYGWIVGEDATIFEWNKDASPAAWEAKDVSTLTTKTLRDVHVPSTATKTVWAVGDEGTILNRASAGTWSKPATSKTASLRGVWMKTTAEGWAVGDDGVALHWKNSTWSSVENGITTKGLRALHINSSDNMVVVGDDGTILRTTIDGASWSSEKCVVDTTADTLKLTTAGGGTQTVKAYTLGIGDSTGTQSGAVSGEDGSPPQAPDFKGKEDKKTGIYALLDSDIFNLLCLPELMYSDDFDLNDHLDVLATAVSFCKKERAFLIIDSPKTWLESADALSDLSDYDSIRSENAAMYFPWIKMSDPLDGNRLKSFPACGMVAGIYARTDVRRGVWKAPAGQTDGKMTGVAGMTYALTDGENGLLNPLGLNCFRIFPVVGPTIWGTRTLVGADVLASEWKYIPVRRTALFIEESLFRGTQWVVFEPNDEPLWSQIRLNVGAFMQTLFRQGAFQGSSPKEAYFVKCDKETTTQNDIDRGIVNILVGFAPLKPAEFVIIKISQIAGEIET